MPGNARAAGSSANVPQALERQHQVFARDEIEHLEFAVPSDIFDARASVDELLAYVLGAPLAKALDLSTPAGFDRAVAALASRLRGVAAGDEGRAVREAVTVLDVDWRRTTAEERRQLVDEAMRRAGRHVRAVPTRLDAPLGDAAVEVVNATRTTARRRERLAIGVEMNALDRRIVRHVTRSQSLFVTDAYGRRLDELGQRVKRVVAEALEAGRDRADIAAELAQLAEGALTGRSRFYWEVVAGAFLGRARSFAQMSSYAEAGIKRYRVVAVLDEATTLQCRFLHGKVFTVRPALAGFDRVDRLSDPEDVKRASPWVRQKGGTLFVEHSSGRHDLASVVRSGCGARDDVGEFQARVDDAALEGLGIGPPRRITGSVARAPFQSPDYRGETRGPPQILLRRARHRFRHEPRVRSGGGGRSTPCDRPRRVRNRQESR